MKTDYFIKGFIIGLSIAAPVGPIGVLTIHRTITQGRIAGFVTGMGAAMADTAFGIVAAFGLTAISSFLLNQVFYIQLIGGLCLIFLGIKSFVMKPATSAANANSKGLINHFVTTFFLTLTNPTTILSFLAIFAGLGLGSAGSDHLSSITFVFGIFLGSALWWLVLSSTIGFFQSKITPKYLVWINRISGFIILSFGIFSLYSCMKPKTKKVVIQETQEQTEHQGNEIEIEIENALEFINSYVLNCNKMKESIEVTKWVDSCKLVSANFKRRVKSLVTEAMISEPEIGLDADPIFDAQDYPEKGFELDYFDQNTQCIYLKGKNWPSFKLTIIMIKEDNQWFVDGCGKINILSNLRIVR